MKQVRAIGPAPRKPRSGFRLPPPVSMKEVHVLRSCVAISIPPIVRFTHRTAPLVSIGNAAGHGTQFYTYPRLLGGTGSSR